MRTSEGLDKIGTALAAWASEAEDPVRASTGQVGQNRGYKYAALDDFMPGLRHSLAKHGIVILQSSRVVEIDPPAAVKVTRLLHASGQWVETDYPLTLNTDPQKQGSADTYARRYGLLSAVGLAAVDDDGKAASTPKDQPRQQERQEEREPAKRKETDEERQARQDGHDPSWERDKAGFFARVCGRTDHEEPNKRGLGFEYDELCEFTDWMDAPRPSQMEHDERERFIKFLGKTEGAEKYAEFLSHKEGR